MKTLAAALLFFSITAHAAWVQQFTPQELVDRQTRATAVFSADMAPLGQAQVPAPFKVDCGAVGGSGRWVDTKTWAWQLDRVLQAGERCLFSLKPGLKASNGEGVSGQNQYRFFAPGPWPRRVQPSPGSGIDEDQAFVITPAGPVQPASVEQNVWCEADPARQTGFSYRRGRKPVARCSAAFSAQAHVCACDRAGDQPRRAFETQLR